MANVLLLTPQLPYPPRQGTSLRNFHIIRGLAKRHNISLLSFEEGVTDAASVKLLQEYCRTVWTVSAPERSTAQRLVRLFGDRRPDMAHRLESTLFDAAVKEIMPARAAGEELQATFDIVQIEGIELAWIIPFIRRLGPNCRIVFDEHNAEAELQIRSLNADLSDPKRWPASFYSWLQIPRLQRYEQWACRASDWVTVVSEPDRKRLARFAPTTPMSVIPNAIDVTEYQAATAQSSLEYDLVFTGKMDYRPNVDAVLWFSREIWPTVLQERPGTSWAIVGQNPHRRLKRLSELGGVTVTGQVEQIQPFIAGATVCIMPFRVGSGTRFKLIEAMAAGKAIVSTGVGAEGFAATNDKELLIANDAAEFASATLHLLNSPEERVRLGEQARLLAQAYDWQKVMPSFDAVYGQLLGDSRPASSS
jgi:glycosyltransferase involved in cell wall biosynthesis